MKNVRYWLVKEDKLYLKQANWKHCDVYEAAGNFKHG